MQALQTTKKQVTLAHIKPFIIRGLALVIGWNLLYQLVLAPLGIPDNQITSAVQWGTAKALIPFFTDVHRSGASVFINHVQCINIAPQCNGLELMVLYMGFILCIPANLRKMILFSIAGLAVIYLLNVIRCTLLAWMYYKNLPLADFAHHYAFKLAIYAVVFYSWTLYVKKPMTHG